MRDVRRKWAALKRWQKVIRACGFFTIIVLIAAVVAQVLRGSKPHPVPALATGSDIVIAIIGGALLALALTRPRVNWRPNLDERATRWRELGLTIFGFFSGGYAFGALFDILEGHVPQRTLHLILPAAFLMLVYLVIIHHEPFVEDGHLRGWCYTGVGIGTMFASFSLADLANGHSTSNDIWLAAGGLLLLVTSVVAFGRTPKPSEG